MSYIENPNTGRRIKVDGPTYKKLVRDGTIPENYLRHSRRPRKGDANIGKQTLVRKDAPRIYSSPGKSAKRFKSKSPSRSRSPGHGHRTGNHSPGCSNQGKYPEVAKEDFCGPEGGACPGTFPVNTPARAHAALAYARNAPNPEGIRKCVRRKEAQKGWTVSKSTGKSTTKRRTKSKGCSACSKSRSRSRSRSRSPAKTQKKTPVRRQKRKQNKKKTNKGKQNKKRVSFA